MIDRYVERLEYLIETGGDREEIRYLARSLADIMRNMPEVEIDTDIDIASLIE